MPLPHRADRRTLNTYLVPECYSYGAAGHVLKHVEPMVRTEEVCQVRTDASWADDPGALRTCYTAIPEDLRDISQGDCVELALHESQPWPVSLMQDCRHVHAYVVGKILREILLQALLFNPTIELDGGCIESTYGTGPVTRLQE